MSQKYFGTDGIRGLVNKGNINGEMFFKFGLAAGTYFQPFLSARINTGRQYLWVFWMKARIR